MNVVAISPHADMPKKYMKRWLDLKEYLITNTPNQKAIFEFAFGMPHLNRCEGGCGGDSNWFDRQIRPLKYDKKCKWHDNKMLYLNFYDSGNEEYRWGLEDIQKLSLSFCEVISSRIGSCGNCFHAYFIL